MTFARRRRLFLSILLLSAVPVAVARAQEKGRASRPIFRFVTARPHGVFRLGEPLDTTGVLGVKIRTGIYRLDRKDGRPVQLGDTQAILVARAPNGRICAFHFLYLADKDFAEAVASYAEDFGPPRSSAVNSGRSRIRAAEWFDTQTRLAVTETVVDSARAVTTVLEERPAPDGCPR